MGDRLPLLAYMGTAFTCTATLLSLVDGHLYKVEVEDINTVKLYISIQTFIWVLLQSTFGNKGKVTIRTHQIFIQQSSFS